ncbi:S49 family peptidase [Arthrobacter humicola]|uniref:S49 family peptidase n=1 Tax=Arthrobacter humicola TaxID=409291 RepID=A0ABN2YBS6_9MICC
MPSWGEILAEIQESANMNGVVDLDGLRRSYLNQLHTLTGRNVVVYATDWLEPKGPGQSHSITLQDIQGLMEVFKDLDKAAGLDLILHSPGGDPTAAASLVQYTRSKFDDVRVIVPVAAMSAATMWALSADRILMGKHSQLGPIDPQLPNPQGYMVPAAAIRKQFKTAQDECAADPAKLSAWVPTLQQFFPGLLEICSDAEELSRAMVSEWLAKYMFKDLVDREDLASQAADFFADTGRHISHSRGIPREQLANDLPALKIENLEDSPELQEAVLSAYHVVNHTLSLTGAMKLIENHLGRAYIKSAQQAQMQVPAPV